MITKQKNTGSHRAIVLAAALACVGSGLNAADSQALAETTNKWVTTAAASLTLTRGNSETFLATVGVDSQRKWAKDEVPGVPLVTGEHGEASTPRTRSSSRVLDNIITCSRAALVGCGGRTIRWVGIGSQSQPHHRYYLIKNDR
jgi:hypothetical protein